MQTRHRQRHSTTILAIAAVVGTLVLLVSTSLGSTTAAQASASGFPLAPRAEFVPAARVPVAVTSLIASAKQSVDVEMYELGAPAIEQALLSAAGRHVKVLVVLDATERYSQQAAKGLAQGGVKVVLVHVTNGIDHIKALSIDGGRAALIGGVNWGPGSSGNWDGDVYIPHDPALNAMVVADSTGAQSASGPLALHGPAIKAALISAIEGAKSSIDVAANYLTEWDVQDALVAAVKRGVTVRVLLNGSAYGAARAAAYLKGRGVAVRYAQGWLHAKYIVADGATLVIGSANFSESGLDGRNHEADVMLTGNPAQAADRLFTTWWGESR